MTLAVCRHRRRPITDASGQVIIVMALALVMVLGLAAFAVDFGYILYARQALQAASDAAATAGAQDINVTGANPITRATQYSAVTGNKNARANLPNVTITSTLKCVNSIGLPACVSPQVNTIVVTQTATLPLYLAKVLGIPTKIITAKATAAMKGGSMPPLDIYIVLDTTQSMENTPLAEAKQGIRTLLGILWPCQQGIATCGASDPVIDQVGLVFFPGLTNVAGNVALKYDCASSPLPAIAQYNASPVYEIIPMTRDYRTSTTATLNQNSNFVKAVDGRTGCSGGQAIGGVKSYFAGAINYAQSRLVSAGRASVQNVIIFVSDGNANEYTGGPTNPCGQAITAAQAAKAAGTWVYSIGYGVESGGCDDDPSPRPTALQTMQRINSDYPLLTKFFNVPSAADLQNTFTKIGTDLLTTRIVDDDTP